MQLTAVIEETEMYNI